MVWMCLFHEILKERIISTTSRCLMFHYFELYVSFCSFYLVSFKEEINNNNKELYFFTFGIQKCMYHYRSCLWYHSKGNRLSWNTLFWFLFVLPFKSKPEWYIIRGRSTKGINITIYMKSYFAYITLKQRHHSIKVESKIDATTEKNLDTYKAFFIWWAFLYIYFFFFDIFRIV